MGTISDKLEYLNTTKAQLSQALTNKGLTPSNNFRNNVALVNSYTGDATAVAGDTLTGKTAYVKNQKITGTMPNNGQLTYSPSDSAQTIPAGYTSGGTVQAADITQLQDYQQSLAISKQILGIDENNG